MKNIKKVVISCIGLLLLSMSAAKTAPAADITYEQPGEYRAHDFLEKGILQGKYHKVDERVDYDGFFIAIRYSHLLESFHQCPTLPLLF